MITTAKTTTTPKIAFRAAIDPKESPFAPGNVAAEDFPRDGSAQDKWKFLLRYAILAPSSHNTQPWLFRLRGGEAELYADRMRACRVVDPDDRELAADWARVGPMVSYVEGGAGLVSRIEPLCRATAPLLGLWAGQKRSSRLGWWIKAWAGWRLSRAVAALFKAVK